MAGNEVTCMREAPVPAAVAHKLFRDVARWPLWFDHLVKVEEPKPRQMKVTMRTAATATASWECEVTQDQPDIMAWASTTGDVVTYGSARFEALGAAKCKIHFRRFHATEKKGNAAILSDSQLADPQAKLEADLARFVAVLMKVAPAPAPQVRFIRIDAREATAKPPPAPTAAGQNSGRSAPTVTRFVAGSSKGRGI